MSSHWIKIARAMVSLFLLGWFFTFVELRSVLEVFSTAQIGPLSLAMLTMLAGLLISVHKWRLLLSCDDIKASFVTFVCYYLIGIFSNNFLPTSIGGDAVRGWLVSSRFGNGTAAIASVLAERLTGLLALLLVAGIGCLNGGLFPGQKTLGVGLAALAICGVALAFCDGWRRWLPPLPEKVRLLLERFFGTFVRYRQDRQIVWTAAWTSLVYPFLVGLVYQMAGRALGVDVGLIDMVVISSLVTLLTLVPISFNGLGLREGGFIYFLGLLDVPRAQALSLSLMVFGLTLLFSLAGGLCLMREGSVPLPVDDTAEDGQRTGQSRPDGE